jgi:hypothetical protein
VFDPLQRAHRRLAFYAMFLNVEGERILTQWEALEGEPSGKIAREIALMPEISQLLEEFAKVIEEIEEFHRTLGTDLTEWDKTEHYTEILPAIRRM